MQTTFTECDAANRLEASPESKPVLRCRPGEFLKCLMDYSVAVLLLIATAPLFLVAALMVKLTSRGPIIYSQTRLGRDGRPYSIYKIRTMHDNCEKQSGICWAQKRDPRVTLIGRFLRATHIDELPQLWNVLRGEMSLIGPRPERPEFFPGLEKALPQYRERLLVRPGLTGLAQVQLAADSDIDSVRRKLALDLLYIEIRSFWLDFRILASTALIVFGVSYGWARFLFALPSCKPSESNGVEAGEMEKVPEILPAFTARQGAANPEPQLESAV